MRKRLTFSAASALLLATTILIVIFVQAQPALTCDTASGDPPSTGVVTYVDDANVILNLPQGTPNHTTNLKIAVSNVNESSDFGGTNVMEVQVWAPQMNSYVVVAILSTNTNQSAIDWILSVVNGTPVWTPPIMQNYFVPTPDELQVWMDDQGVLMANLTASFNVTLPDMLGGNFTIPPMTLMFRPIGSGFPHNETVLLAKPQLSGWTITQNHTDVPAWVRAEIPMWVKGSYIETVGTLAVNGTSTYIPPSP